MHKTQKLLTWLSVVILWATIFTTYANIVIPLSFEWATQYVKSFFITENGSQTGSTILEVNPNGSWEIYLSTGLSIANDVTHLWVTLSGKLVKTNDQNTQLSEWEVDAFVNNNWYLTNTIWTKNWSDVLYNGGNVGIGTDSPFDGDFPGIGLHVNGTGYVRAMIEASSAATLELITNDNTSDLKNMSLINDGDKTWFRLRNDDFTTNKDYLLTMDHTNGNVGIGTDSPTEKLHISSVDWESVKIGVSLFLSEQYSSRSSIFWFNAKWKKQDRYTFTIPNTWYDTLSPQAIVMGDVNDGISFVTTDIDPTITWEVTVVDNVSMKITKAGNVGIGTINPSSTLSVKWDNGISIDATTDWEFLWKMRMVNWVAETAASKDDLLIETPGGILIKSDYNKNGISANISFGVYTSWNIDQFIVKNDGNVGIGTISPTEKLTVSGSITNVRWSNGNILFYESDYARWNRIGLGANGSWAYIYSAYGSLGTNNLIINKGQGNVGIGTNSPQYKLDVNGQIRSSDGVLTSSDARLKQNITTIGSALDKVLWLRWVYFDRKDSSNKWVGSEIGFIAQEVEKIFPGLVATDNKWYKSVAYSNITAILVEAVKEQQSIIEEQNTQINKNIQDIQLLQSVVATQTQKIDELYKLLENK